VREGETMSDMKLRLRDAATAIALCPQMATVHGETCDSAHDEIERLVRERNDLIKQVRQAIDAEMKALDERDEAAAAALEEAKGRIYDILPQNYGKGVFAEGGRNALGEVINLLSNMAAQKREGK